MIVTYPELPFVVEAKLLSPYVVVSSCIYIAIMRDHIQDWIKSRANLVGLR